VAGADDRVEGQGGARRAFRVEPPDRGVPDDGVELAEEPHPERIAIHPAWHVGFERGPEAVLRGTLVRMDAEAQPGDEESRRHAEQGPGEPARDQASGSRPAWSSMGFPCGVARAARSHSVLRRPSSSAVISPFSPTSRSSVASQ
jgi:hypothetical protein